MRVKMYHNILTYTAARTCITVSLLHLQVVAFTELALVQIRKAGCFGREIELLQANDVLSRQIVLGLANNAIQMPGQRAYQAE